jgi:geranylgeranyl pyrophosphate synthase
MTNRFGENVCLHGETGPSLTRVFHPVSRDLKAAQERLVATLTDTQNRSVREIVDFLLGSPGKRIRPALVLLSARAAYGRANSSHGLSLASLNVAAAMEIIHMASLVHDDLVDDAAVRHHRSSVQAKWGKRVSVAVGDYLCAKAFQLVADCADPRLFAVLGSQLCEMCDGEIQQVVGRGDFGLSERRCLDMIEKKTAALFGACCGAGAATAVGEPKIWKALQDFGLHFGVAFQILDDCKDLLSDQEGLGKTPGQDLLAGDVTLPLLYAVWDCCRRAEEPLRRSGHVSMGLELARIGEAFHSSPAPARIAALIASQVGRAKQALQPIVNSEYRDSLYQMADDIAVSASCILAR